MVRSYQVNGDTITTSKGHPPKKSQEETMNGNQPKRQELVTTVSHRIPTEVTHASQIYGEWGPYQRNVAIYFFTIYFIAAFQNVGIAFYTPPIDYHCKLTSVVNESVSHNVSKCFAYEGSSEPCSEWTYDHSFYKSTLIDAFDLVCGREYFISMTKSIYQIGYLVASILTGWMADKYGRRFTFVFSVVFEILSSFLQMLAVDIHQFLLARFLVGIGSYGRFSVSATLMFELVSI